MKSVGPEKAATPNDSAPARKGPGFQYYENLASERLIYFNEDGELCHWFTQGQIELELEKLKPSGT